jgi:O-antigen ligase
VTLDPRPVPRAQIRAMQQTARDQARGVSSALVIGVAMALALGLVLLFAVLDYHLGQATHRLIKILAGGGLFATIVLWPRIGLMLFPLLVPFIIWFPRIPIPGVNPLNIILGTVFAAWATGRVLRREPIVRGGRIGWALVAIMTIAALSIVRGGAFPTGYHYEVGDSSISLFRVGVTFATYFIALCIVRGERDRKLLTWAIVIGLLAEALVTARLGRNGRGGRAIGSVGQSNELGAFLAMYSVVAAALFLGVRNWFGKAVLMGTFVVGCYALMISLSRGSMLALAAGLVYIGFRTSRVLGVLVVLALVASPLWAPQYVKDRMMETQRSAGGGSDEMELEGSSQLRIDTWKAIGKLVADHPLDGVGFDGLSYVLPETGEELGIEVKDSAHNTFMRFLGEMGIFGLAAFCFLLWKCWRLSVEGMNAARTMFDRQLSIGLGGATIAMAVSCAFGDRFFSVIISGSFWFMCALVDDLVQERRPAL